MLRADQAGAGRHGTQDQSGGEQGQMQNRGSQGRRDSGGLSTSEAVRRRVRYGPNTIEQGRTTPPLTIFLRQFRSPLILILFIAAALATALGETIDAVAILAIVLVNGVLGFVQEWRAERAIDALRDMLAPTAEVIRDDQPTMIPATELVPGDLVILTEGQKVPADITLEISAGLRIDESALSGESVPVDRSADDAENAVFMGTLIVGGRGEGWVTATGTSTRFGQIAELTRSAGEKTTRLQAQLSGLSRRLGLWGLGVAAAVFLLGLLGGRALFDMVLTSVSLAVAVVPEGLPLVVTLTLAIGASAMVRQKALLRRLQAAETLGSASVICTDKTGTLTENRMTATRVLAGGRVYEATGTGYDPAGRILLDGKRVLAAEDPTLMRLLHAALVCNHARLDRREDWEMTGDPTEGALVTLAYKGWTPLPDGNARIAEAPFSSERKRMAVLSRRAGGELGLFVKGAPEAVLPVCTDMLVDGRTRPLDAPQRSALTAQYEAMARDGLRVIAIADRDASGPGDLSEDGLVLLGFVGLLDAPRPEVADAVRLCRSAGIRILMITGDSATTAEAIAGRIGLRSERAVTGADLDAMNDRDLSDTLARDVLFARTTPSHKMRIVEHLQQAGEVVAMTGDGVNDAPALKRADIGVAMGQRGTDVAKEAADLVILDDNFATIVAAIREGRRQFGNIRKFVRYLLASNSAEVIALAVNLLIGGPLVLLPVHILWINLLTDGVSAVALGLEKAEPEQMSTPPIARDAQVLTREGLVSLAAFGVYMAAVSLALFYVLLDQGEALARTVAFTTLVTCQELAVFAFRSNRHSALRLGLLSNPWLLVAVAGMFGLQALALYWPPLQLLLGTVPLGIDHLALVAAAAVPVVFGPTLAKTLRSRRRRAS
jgi:Ca2+-transporting ATPase